MGQVIDQLFANLLYLRGYAVYQAPRRNSTNTGWEWGTPFYADTPGAAGDIVYASGANTFVVGPASNVLGYTAVEFDPVALPSQVWTSAVRANDLAGADGSALPSWALAAGTSSAFTQATGANQPTVKTGVNGIGGYKVVRFDGGNDSLATTNGGLALKGDFDLVLVCRWTSLTGGQNVLSWGDSGVTGKRRSVYKQSDSAGGNANKLAIIGESADFNTTQVIAAATTYVIRVQRSGTTVTVWVNGTSVGSSTPSYVAYTSDVIKLGCNPGGTEFFNGDIAEAWLLGSTMQAGTLARLYQYLQGRYGVTLSGAAVVYGRPRYTAAGLLTVGPDYWNGTQTYTPGAGLVLGGSQPFLTGQTPYTLPPAGLGGPTTAPTLWAQGTALLTAWGVFTAYALDGAAGEHLLSVKSADNVAAVWNRQSWSALRYLNAAGYECGALGVAQVSSGTILSGAAQPAAFWEISNFSTDDVYGDGRIAQSKKNTGASTATIKLRTRYRYDTQGIEDYDLTAAEPGVSGPTTGLVSLRGVPVAAVANAGVLLTNITAAAGYGGAVKVYDATNNRLGRFVLEGTGITADATNNAQWTTTKDTANKVNVYVESGQVKVQNNSGGGLNLKARYDGV